MVKCRLCHGTGRIEDTEGFNNDDGKMPCTHCEGDGIEPDED
jgi:DnaJ-class molecular chaperone